MIPKPLPFYTGADVSWLTEMEASGKKFLSRENVPTDLFALLKTYHMDVIRLRIWVDPPDGYNSLQDVLAKAQRAQQAGFEIMLDFHYSDSWADPGKQNKPARWANTTLPALADSVREYTVATLNAFKTKGLNISWVQIGNEINDGLLWPEGRATTSFTNLTQLTNEGYTAVKKVMPATPVIIHLSDGDKMDLFKWFFTNFFKAGGKCDVIGLSLYPTVENWKETVEKYKQNAQYIINEFHRPVYLVEFGMPHDAPTDTYYAIRDLYSLREALKDNFLGMLYWEPECYAGWKGYTKGAFDDNGVPTAALDAFLVTE